MVPAAAGLAGMTLALPAAADPVNLDTATATVALQPYVAPATLGSRAQLSATLGSFDTQLTAAVERGGAGVRGGGAAWDEIYAPSAWIGDDLKLGANLSLGPDARLSFEAGDRERRTSNAVTPLVSAPDAQIATDQSSYMRVRASADVSKLRLQLGAETATTALDTETLGSAAGEATRLWLTSRKLSADLVWRPTSRLTLEGGESAQSFSAGWRGTTSLGASDAYITPNLALTLTPWSSGRWRVEAEETLSPVEPAKFAAYAQIATPGAAFTPQPDRGWRYGLKLEQALPAGVKLTAQAAQYRLVSVTEMGPVGTGEAPVGVGPGQRQEVSVNLAAPVAVPGLPRASLAGEVALNRSEVLDPFTGERRGMSGESPYRARLQLSGALPSPSLNWSLSAQAEGPQSVWQMAQVTNLGPSAGLGGALTYGAGPVKMSLEVDNLLGGARDVTTLSYAGTRADNSISDIARRKDEARAIRFALRRGL